MSFIRSDDVLAVLPTGFGKSLFQLIPGLCVELHNLGYSHYPKSLIVIVIWPLNAQIECYMSELKHRGDSCTCLSDAVQLSILICDENLRCHNIECKYSPTSIKRPPSGL